MTTQQEKATLSNFALSQRIYFELARLCQSRRMLGLSDDEVKTHIEHTLKSKYGECLKDNDELYQFLRGWIFHIESVDCDNGKPDELEAMGFMLYFNSIFEDILNDFEKANLNRETLIYALGRGAKNV